MRRKSKSQYLKYAFAAYVVVAVCVVGYGWMSRTERDPLAHVPGYSIRVTDGYDSLAGMELRGGSGAASETDAQADHAEAEPVMEVAIEPEAVVEPEAGEVMAAETTAESRDDLRLDDLKLPGEAREADTLFEELEPNPYLVTD